MRVWTIQKKEFYDKLMKDGVIRTDANLIDKDFKHAYDWLVDKMKSEIGEPPKGVKYPIWAWHTRDFKHKKPDLRNTGYESVGVRCVCLEIEIPDDQVLLSDFNAWHYVLNDWWYDNKSNNQYEADVNRDWYDSLHPIIRKKLKVESWDNIFDVEPFKSDWKTVGDYVQATFWELRSDMVKRVTYFTAR